MSRIRFTKLVASLLAAVFLLSLASGSSFSAPQGVAPPQITSPSCVVMDALSGEVLFEKNSRERRAPASLTKIMTLGLALEQVAAGKAKLSDEAVTSENAWEMGGTEVWAEPGESMPLEEWLKAVAVASANDAAVIVAEHIGGSEEAFVEMMNQKARDLGLADTSFKNPHGLDEDGHYTTAMDMAVISRWAIQVPGLLDFTKIYQTKFRGGKNELTNFNKLVYLYPGCDGLKTGMTNKSGYCISATASRDGSRFIVVIMGASDPDQRLNEAWKLLDWAFKNFRSLEIVKEGVPLCKVRVFKGKSDFVEACAQRDFAVTLTKDQKGEVRCLTSFSKVTAPVKRGDIIGRVDIEVDGKKVTEVALVAGSDVSRATFLDYTLRFLKAFIVGN